MIRHTPLGRGHPYRPSLDQRVPAVPLAHEPVQLRALVDDRAETARLEVDHGGRIDLHEPRPLTTDAAASDDVDGGHLAAAAAAGEHVEGMRPVAVELAGLPAGEPVRYRWRADADTTDWFDFTPATWSDRGGDLELVGPRQLHTRVLGAPEWLAAGSDGPVRVRVRLRLDPDEHVLGLGERFHALDHRGHAVDTVVFEQYKQQGRRTYLPVPFALIVGGAQPWGLHVETTRRCWFDVAASAPDVLTIEAVLDPDDPHVGLRLYAGTPPEILDGFLDDTARPAPVPSWAFRPWASANEWNTQARVEAEIERSLRLGIPVGVVVIEAWSDEATFTVFRDAEYAPTSDGSPLRLDDFSFPADGAWPDPAAMVERLHDLGVRVLLWQIPLLPTDVPDDRPGARQLAHDRAALIDTGHAVRESDGSPYRNRGWWFPGALLPDFTSGDATGWWIDKRRYLIEDLGIDGFKTDGGEHAWGDELRYADGTRGDQTNNRYPNLYAAAYHRLLEETDTRGVTFSRAGFTGAGATPCHWAGDEDSTWEALRASILAGISAGICGISAWGFDHGGFSGPIPSAELYLRSAAVATFCPIMQYHAEYNHHRRPCRDRTPWNIAERHAAPGVIDAYRELARLRDRLVPYLDEQYHDGIRTGLPLMRALALHWPDDRQVWDFPYQYLLGGHLLVAPVVEPGVTSLEVYLPAGTWTDLWTGAAHDGPDIHHAASPLGRIPVFVSSPVPGRVADVVGEDGPR